jgi:predicted dehydrogenase
MADPLRVAVIGVGAMGSNHVRVYEEMPDADLVAIADSNESPLCDSNVRAYADYRRMLDEENLDAVSIAVPALDHREVALACIERRIAILIEKPIAGSAADGEALLAAALAVDVPLMVGHIERFNPAVIALKRCISGGDLGQIYQARAQRVGPFFRRHRDVGVVHDLATHDIDILHDLLGADVTQVEAKTQRGIRTEHEDTLAGLLLYETGTVAQIEANWISPRKSRRLELLGTHGMFVLDYIKRSLVHYPTAAASESAGELIAVPDAEVEPLRAELSAFVRAVQKMETPPVNAEDGIRAVRVADALVEAGRTRGPVQLKAAGGTR